MDLNTFLFLLFLFTLITSGAAGVQRQVMPNVVAVLLVLFCSLVGMFWASSCFPSGFLHYFMPMFVLVTCTHLLNQILAPLPEPMCRAVMGRVAQCLLVPVTAVCIWAVPTLIETTRESARLERTFNAQYASMQEHQARFKQGMLDMQVLAADKAFTLEVIVEDAVKGRYGEN